MIMMALYNISESFRFHWLLVLIFSSLCFANDGLYGSSKYPNDIPEYDLLHAIGVPFSNPKTQYFDEGLDGFPAYGLRPGSDIKSPYRLFMPEKLYSEFSITATVRPANKDGGFLFSVVNPLETVVQLGVQLIPSGPGLTNISLLYTDANIYALSQTIASFVVPSFAKKWSRFALRVTEDNVTLFWNCHEFNTVVVKRNPMELVFDSASTLYVGQAGPLIRGAFHPALSTGAGKKNNVKAKFRTGSGDSPAPQISTSEQLMLDGARFQYQSGYRRVANAREHANVEFLVRFSSFI